MAVVIGNALEDLSLDIRARRPLSRYYRPCAQRGAQRRVCFCSERHRADPDRSCLLFVGGSAYHVADCPKPNSVPDVTVQFALNSRTQS